MNYEAKLMLKDEQGIFFGPGVAELLTAIDKTGNVKDAAATMNLSYTKAWVMLRNTKRGIGKEVVERITGGVGGGSARLTEEGKKLLNSYNSFKKDAENLLQEAFRRNFSE